MLEFLSLNTIFQFGLVFARVGTALLSLPGISSEYISTRARIFSALSICLLLFPFLEQYIPKISNNNFQNITSLFFEIFIGLLITVAAKFYYSVINTVGQIISLQSGLGMASFYDPNQRTQVTVFSNFMLLILTVFIFQTDLHHKYIYSFFESYERFPPGEIILAGDVSNYVIKVASNSFMLAFKLAAPFIVVSMAILTGSGALARIMPNLQIFFIVSPLQVMVLIATLYIVINQIILKLISVIADSVNSFVF